MTAGATGRTALLGATTVVAGVLTTARPAGALTAARPAGALAGRAANAEPVIINPAMANDVMSLIRIDIAQLPCGDYCNTKVA